jgi:hypothetical protein
MKQYRFTILFGTILAKLFTAFCFWHSPRRRKLTREEIDHYMAIIEKLPARAEGIQAFTSRIRPWAEADDGKPVFMLNLIRFYPQLHTFTGAPEFKGTPEEANAYYEKSITPLWLSHAAYPVFAGASQAKNLINIQPEKDWGRVVVCRYPSRRTFLKLLSDPSYAPMEPYKFIALEIDLVPVSGEMVIPDLRLIVGGSLLALFLAVNWFRAARRGHHNAA